MAAKAEYRDAQRLQESFLAPLEKKALIWLAERMPRWVNSDHLTALGLLSLLAAGLAYWAAASNVNMVWVVTACLVLNWFGDSLDGTLARVRNAQRPRYGFYVDHMVDCFGTLFLLGGLALSGFMTPAVAAIALIAYFMLSIESYLATHTIGRFHISHWKFGPTELRLLIIAGSLQMLRSTETVLFGETYKIFDIGAVVGTIAMTAMLITITVKHTVELYRQETL